MPLHRSCQTLADPHAPALDSLLWIPVAHFRKYYGSFSVIGHGEYGPRVQRRPSFGFQDLPLLLRLDQHIARTQRQVIDATHVDEARSYIEQERLIIGIDGVKRLRSWHERVDLRRDRFHL